LEVEEAVSRWHAFLSKIDDRVRETLAVAREGCATLIDTNDLDPLPMTNAWSGIQNQVHELLKKVQETWQKNVAPTLEDKGLLFREQCEKGEELRRSVEEATERARVAIFADAARKVLAQAKANLAGEFHCTQCGAVLAISDRFFRSRHVACPYCNCVNTFVPGTKVMAVEHFCCHHLAREAALDLHFIWERAEARMKGRGSEDLTILEAAERALGDYTRAYLLARIALVPEYEKDFDRDFRGRMAEFYQQVAHYPAWKGAAR
jgi:hypothetical protein